MGCWKCQEAVQGPVCVGCGSIQPLAGAADHYAVIGLPRRYHIEAREIEEAWRALSRKVHPDRFARRPAVERRMSLQWTASLNEARRVLRDPTTRARFLATGKAEPDERDRAIDPDFLEQIFELQTRVDEEPQAVAAEASALRTAAFEALDALFTRWETEPTVSLAPAVGALSRVKYLDTLLASVAGNGGHLGQHRH
jgi:molecular chaperone HscB